MLCPAWTQVLVAAQLVRKPRDPTVRIAGHPVARFVVKIVLVVAVAAVGDVLVAVASAATTPVAVGAVRRVWNSNTGMARWSQAK